MDRHTRTQLDIWAEALWQERLTRRDFVRRGIAMGVASSLLVEIVGLYTHKAAAETGPAPQVLERIKKEGKKLFVYNWEDYVNPNTIPQFEKEFGVKVTYDTYPSNEQLLAKLQAGGVKYDVIFPTQNFLPIYIPQKLPAPLNHEHLPNLQNVLERFRDTPFDPGNTYTVPYGWGTTGMAYNTTYAK